ncbi:hypothetical protein Hanom_Chr12g01137341 [Helianthus anomalus]
MVGMRKTLVFYKVSTTKTNPSPFLLHFSTRSAIRTCVGARTAELDRRPNAFFIFEQRRKLSISAMTTVKILRRRVCVVRNVSESFSGRGTATALKIL